MDAAPTLRALAGDAGFSIARIARVRRTPRGAFLDRWLARGRHATMHWMARGRDPRVDPRARAAWARTALVLAVRHHHVRPPDPGGRTGLVARYAWGRDYHNVVGKRLKSLQRRLREAGIRSWGGTDTAPIVERAWADAAGLGFSGKNTVQILPGTTSWMFLAVLFVDVEAEPDRPIVRDHCGSCVRCLSACPTGAFAGPRDLDAGRCISYWTIEARELAPAELLPRFGRWVFGCDACQEVCPHNHAPPDSDEDAFLPRHAYLDLDEIVAAPDEALLERFTGTPLRRPGAEGLKRNALVALGNLGDVGAADGIRRHAIAHPSPMVRAAAEWALSRL